MAGTGTKTTLERDAVAVDPEHPDGKSENIESKAGQFMCFTEPWEHLPENLGDDRFEVVYVELKG